jgi:hypothetical protein
MQVRVTVIAACLYVVTILLCLLLLGCTGELLQRLEQDIVALRERVQAREEVRIQVAGATPTTVAGTLQTPQEPHVSVGLPPCPPAVSTPALHRQRDARESLARKWIKHKRGHKGKRR